MPEDVEPSRRPARGWGFELRDFAPLLTLAVLVGFFSLVTEEFLSPGTLRQVLSQGAVLAIVSVGLTFVLLCGEIDLSVGTVALWAACTCGVLYEHPSAAGRGGQAPVGLATVALVIAAPLLGTIVMGLVTGALTVWSRLPSFILSLAMMNIAVGLARYETRSEKFKVPDVLMQLGNEEWVVGDGDWRFWIPYSAGLAAAVLLVGHLVLEHTRFGRYVLMTGGNREAARLAGVRTGGIIVACLALSALTAGMGGLVNAGRLESVSLDQNADLLLSAVACVVLGGTSLFGGEGSMPRTLLGVATFSVLGVGLNRIDWIDDLMRPFLLGVVLLAALLFNGLLARRSAAR